MRALALVLACGVLAAGCLGGAVRREVTVGTTTTTQDAGLLDALLPAFERDTGVRARAVVGGTGEILEKGKRGDVDVLLTHAPERERRLLSEGWTLRRDPVMFNRFALAGPDADPAGVRAARDAADALRRIHDNASLFASRGDASGTHDKEIALWRAAGLDPGAFSRAWYKETGAGQGVTLLYADERGAYLLLDQSTLARFHANGKARATLDLHHADPALRNEYAVSRLDPARVPGVDAALADAFADWLLSPAGHAAIASVRVDGAPAFTPHANTTAA